MKNLYKTLAVACKVFYFAWAFLFALLVIYTLYTRFMDEPTISLGIGSMLATFDPFSVANAISIFILLLPAILAYQCEEFFKRKMIKVK